MKDRTRKTQPFRLYVEGLKLSQLYSQLRLTLDGLLFRSQENAVMHSRNT